jgi:hypothetical protein
MSSALANWCLELMKLCACTVLCQPRVAHADNDLNDVRYPPGGSLPFTVNESIIMATCHIPQLGPAPRYCLILENMTEEVEHGSGSALRL